MEYKTCEEFVLGELEEAYSRIDDLNELVNNYGKIEAELKEQNNKYADVITALREIFRANYNINGEFLLWTAPELNGDSEWAESRRSFLIQLFEAAIPEDVAGEAEANRGAAGEVEAVEAEAEAEIVAAEEAPAEEPEICPPFPVGEEAEAMEKLEAKINRVANGDFMCASEEDSLLREKARTIGKNTLGGGSKAGKPQHHSFKLKK